MSELSNSTELAPKRFVQKTYGNEIGGAEMVAPKRRDPNGKYLLSVFLWTLTFMPMSWCFIPAFLSRDTSAVRNSSKEISICFLRARLKHKLRWAPKLQFIDYAIFSYHPGVA